MKQFTEAFVVALDKTTGKEVLSEKGTKVAVSARGHNIWFPKEANLGKYIGYKLHEKGDTFVANRDSSRTKGVVLGENCPKGQEDEPLYLKGETVTRNNETIEFVGFTESREATEATLEEKFALAQKYSVKLSI